MKGKESQATQHSDKARINLHMKQMQYGGSRTCDWCKVHTPLCLYSQLERGLHSQGLHMPVCVHNVCAKEVMQNANGVESVVLEPNTSALCVKKAASPDCFFCVQDGQWVG